MVERVSCKHAAAFPNAARHAGTVVGETNSLPISEYTIKRPKIVMSDDKINSG
jgi:hypothetical protein